MISKFKHIKYKPSKEEKKIVCCAPAVSFINRNIAAVSKKDEPRAVTIETCSDVSLPQPNKVVSRRDRSLQQIAARNLFTVA